MLQKIGKARRDFRVELLRRTKLICLLYFGLLGIGLPALSVMTEPPVFTVGLLLRSVGLPVLSVGLPVLSVGLPVLSVFVSVPRLTGEVALPLLHPTSIVLEIRIPKTAHAVKWCIQFFMF